MEDRSDQRSERGLHPSRTIGPVLMAAIIVVPGVFGRLLLRKGYARSTRFAALFYGGVTFIVGAIGRFGG